MFPYIIVALRVMENQSFIQFIKTDGGGKRDRTADPLLARQVLSQLSYTPKKIGKTPIPENKCPVNGALLY